MSREIRRPEQVGLQRDWDWAKIAILVAEDYAKSGLRNQGLYGAGFDPTLSQGQISKLVTRNMRKMSGDVYRALAGRFRVVPEILRRPAAEKK